MPSDSPLAMLRLTLVEGVGPILGRRLLLAFGGAASVFSATPAELERVEGIGSVKARRIAESIRASEAALDREVSLVEKLRVRVVALGDPLYPALLAQCPDAPLVLYVRGSIPCPQGSYALGIVGSRHCTPYGIEQAERFAAWLGQSGLWIISGGARGVDSAAHRAAVRVNAPTVAVLGCGLSHVYPPENAELFDRIVDTGGSIISELPLGTSPSPENFPARNRLIVGLSLGVLVIEAPKGSGALITARIALDDYNREVMAIPGRIDSRASEGSNDLIKKGEAAMITSPADVLDSMESLARHQFGGTHAHRFEASPAADRAEHEAEENPADPALFDPAQTPAESKKSNHAAAAIVSALTETQRRILEALVEPRSMAELCRSTGLEPAVLQAETTLLEIRKVVVRQGGVFARRHPNP